MEPIVARLAEFGAKARKSTHLDWLFNGRFRFTILLVLFFVVSGCVSDQAGSGPIDDCYQAVEFLRERRRRVAPLLDANAEIKEMYGISIGQNVRRQDADNWNVENNVFEKNAAEGRWITILPPRHPQALNTRIHIHLDLKTRRINGIRAYVPVKVNGKGRDVFASVSDSLLEPFEKIVGRSGEYYESSDNVVTKRLKLIDAANENWLKISYTTRYFGAHLELESYGTCFAEFNGETEGE